MNLDREWKALRQEGGNFMYKTSHRVRKNLSGKAWVWTPAYNHVEPFVELKQNKTENGNMALVSVA